MRFFLPVLTLLAATICVAEHKLDLTSKEIDSHPALREHSPTVVLSSEGDKLLRVQFAPLSVNRIPSIRANFDSLQELGKNFACDVVSLGILRGYRMTYGREDMVSYCLEAEGSKWRVWAEIADQDDIRRIDQFLTGLKLTTAPTTN